MTLPAQDIVERREWLIRKDGYFYRPNCQGYTTRKIEAGRYTKAKAEAEAAIEPWHMSAVHQDEVPDEPAVADLNASISRLTADNEAVRARLTQMTRSRDDNQKDALRLLSEKMDILEQKIAAENRVTALEAALLAIRETYCHSRGTRLPIIAQIDDVVSAALGGSDHG